jgi:predicted XRE-type DNA-binding protein
MTQAETAEKLWIAQSRVSSLMRGKWEKFSLEMLITLQALTQGNFKTGRVNARAL